LFVGHYLPTTKAGGPTMSSKLGGVHLIYLKRKNK